MTVLRREGTIRCPHCGTENRSDQFFCTACRKNLTVAPAGLAAAEDVVSEARSPTAEPPATLATRYQDAYRQARVLMGAGGIVKTLAVLLGLQVGIGLTLWGGWASELWLSLLIGVFVGSVVATLVYPVGVLISALGQILMATLDGAVNSSPLLDDGQKASVIGVAKK